MDVLERERSMKKDVMLSKEESQEKEVEITQEASGGSLVSVYAVEDALEGDIEWKGFLNHPFEIDSTLCQQSPSPFSQPSFQYQNPLSTPSMIEYPNQYHNQSFHYHDPPSIQVQAPPPTPSTQEDVNATIATAMQPILAAIQQQMSTFMQ